LIVQGVMVLADDNPAWKLSPVEQARAACQGGASAIQLRAKFATDRVALEWAVEIRELTRDFGARLFINDRFDLALLADADGVHLGQDDIAPDRIPSELRDQLAIGRSTHTIAQVDAAKSEPVDYIAFGPIFGTQSKDSPYPPAGIDRLAQVVQRCAPRPVVAIGGIEYQHVEQLTDAGASAIAVISAVAAADDPVQAARRLVDAMAHGISNPTRLEPPQS
jgi:thiamine-phosphate pyrophosphorylase